VIMDVHMAIKDGIDATREIRFWEGSKRGTGEHLPIVALTGSASPDVEQECLAAGMVSSCTFILLTYIFVLTLLCVHCAVLSMLVHYICSYSKVRMLMMC
jgi:CheY-like chemotaxis protein